MWIIRDLSILWLSFMRDLECCRYVQLKRLIHTEATSSKQQATGDSRYHIIYTFTPVSYHLYIHTGIISFIHSHRYHVIYTFTPVSYHLYIHTGIISFIHSHRYHIIYTFTPVSYHLYIHTKAITLLVCANVGEWNDTHTSIFYNLHELNIELLFSSRNTIYCDALHTRWFMGWHNKPLQTTPIHSYRRYGRKVGFDTYRLALSDNFKSISLSFRCERFTL
jgi:hypothetical protein